MEREIALFKALADPTRLRLAVLLSIRGETCVCYLAQALDEPDFKISRHLGIMRSSGIVEARREGTWMYYKLTKPRSGFEGGLHKGFRKYLAADNPFQADLKRLDIATSPK
ncbi:MAG: ArsR/SmtB family transcription factor [Candidatus Aminicenantales bacterium]